MIPKYLNPLTGKLEKLYVPVKAITNITVNGDVNVNAPSYVIAEADRVAGIVNSRNGNLFKIIGISDMHQPGDGETVADGEYITAGNRHAGQGAAIIANKVKPDLLANFGDFIWGSDTTTVEQAVSAGVQAHIFTAQVQDENESIKTPGNHDPNISGEDLPEAVVSGIFGGYKYIDFEEKKIRVIVLDTADISGNDGAGLGGGRISGEQLQWFCESLDLSVKSDAAEWGIIILSHHPLDWCYCIAAANAMQAYIEGASYSVTHNGVAVSYDFNGKNAAKIICQLHGHLHNFKVDYINYQKSGVITPTTVQRIAIPNACYSRNNTYGRNDGTEYLGIEFGETTTYNKTANSAESTAFCVVSFDLDNGIIYADCYGAGYDRIISYAGEEVVTYSVSNSLTNATTSNSASVVVEGASYSATITAKTGYTLEGGSVSVKMGGVDITSSAVTGGDRMNTLISIGEVTGDIVISVVAVVDENAEVTKHTITNNLTNIATSNTDTEIQEGAEYGAVLSVTSGYQMQSVVVTMGGVDITATAYSGNLSGGNINIEAVTGDIVITAAAILPSYTNLVPTATAVHGGTEIYNGIGYKNGAYVSSGGSFGDDASTVAVGYLLLPQGSAIYVKGATLTTTGHVRIYTESLSGNAYIYCNGDKLSLSEGIWISTTGVTAFYVEQLGDDYYKITPNTDGQFAEDVYYRISLVGTGENLIITHNEEIE